MSIPLTLPEGENPLVTAYREIQRSALPDANDVLTTFNEHLAGLLVTVRPAPLLNDRVSIVDPNIRLVIRASSGIV